MKLRPNAALAVLLGLVCIAVVDGVAADFVRAPRIGELTRSGSVWINDTLLPSGSGLHAGDEVRTGAAALGVVDSAAFGRLEVRQESQVRLNADSVELARGAVASNRAAIRIQDVRIEVAQPDQSWFVVSRTPNGTLVAAHRGSAIIRSAGAAPLTVPEGSYALSMAASSGAPTAGRSNAKGDADRATQETDGRGAAQAGRKGGWKLGSLASPKGAIILTGVAAAAVTGVVAGGGTRDEAVSPQD